MIPVTCKTNLDDYDCYVTNIICTPKIRDKVAVLHKGVKRSLYIVQITHDEIVIGSPHIILELNK